MLTEQDKISRAEAGAARPGPLAFISLIARTVRVHQWSKNLLVFVPLIISHEFDPIDMAGAILAFLGFSFVASAGYIFNDLRDLASDRLHASKRYRSFASGELDPRFGYALIPALLMLAGGVAWFLPLGFAAALVIYLLTTLGYTLLFKRMLGLDIVVIACMYVLRVVAGDEAIGADFIGLDSSDWILGFSCLLFLSLALIKRCSELSVIVARDESSMPGRAYRAEDFHVMISLAGASALCSMAIFVRYIGSPDVYENFSHPRALWLILPLMLYWLIRLILLANRRKIKEDPVVFTLRDLKSQLCGAVILVLLMVAW